MSEPRGPLDYEPPNARPRTTLMFFGWLVIGAVLTPVVALGAIAVVASAASRVIGYLGGAAIVATAIGLIVLVYRSTHDAARRTAVLSGLFVGVGVALLLVGACFALFLGGV